MELKIGKSREEQGTKSWFFEKFNKIDKSLERLTKIKRERRYKSPILEIKQRLLIQILQTSK